MRENSLVVPLGTRGFPRFRFLISLLPSSWPFCQVLCFLPTRTSWQKIANSEPLSTKSTNSSVDVCNPYASPKNQQCRCVADAGNLQGTCRELAGNLQTNGTAYIRNSRLNAWIHTYFLPSLRSKNRILLASPLFHTERAKNNNTPPQLHTYNRLLTPHHGQ